MRNHCLTKLSLIIFFISILCHSATAQLPKKTSPPQRIYGLTIENLDTLDVTAFERAFNNVTAPITLRIVFQRKTLPSKYDAKLRALHNYTVGGVRKFYIMALPFDSEALKEYKLSDSVDPTFNCETLTQGDIDTRDMNYNQRAKCFVDHFRGVVDAWEVGNEVNGEWVDESYDNNTSEIPLFAGEYETTIKKIETLVDLVPSQKPLMLAVSYMPGCGEWKHNAMAEWIKHFSQPTIDKIDYVLISYYEDKCNYKVLDENEINNSIIKPLRTVFKNQFIGFGETGYSVDEGDKDSSETCPDNKNCYCRKGGKPPRKSKTSQMQRYYSFKGRDNLYIGGGFWWNADEDYKVPDFLAALKNQFNCLSTNQQCPITPVDCR